MAVTYAALKALRSENVRYAWTERDSLLYALAVGMGRDPLDRRELPFVWEGPGLRTLPTQAVTVARQNLTWSSGLDVPRILHGGQTLTLHRPLPPEGEILADHCITAVHDRGPGRGAIIELATRARQAVDGVPLFDIAQTLVARGDGGIGGPSTRPSQPHPMPTRPPDLVCQDQTHPEQALLYRLTGDRNLIHVDPELAVQMGFRAPILHGSCTLAIACRAILASVCDYDDARIASIGCRFSAIGYPGETLETAIWVDGHAVSYRVRVVERDTVILDHGLCVLRPH